MYVDQATRSAAGRGIAQPLRVALFSGNYNIVRDGANKALNRLVGFLLDRGAAVRIYSPTVDHPAFEPVGNVVSIPSMPIPGRSEYRLGLGLTPAIRDDIRRFAPTLFHLSAPDLVGRQAQTLARDMGVPVVTSLHTRFETYLRYYRLGFLASLTERWLYRFYGASDCVLAPNPALAEELSAVGLGTRVRIWGRGVDRTLFNPQSRDLRWRREQGFEDDEIVLLFFGRLVREKGTDRFVEIVQELRRRGHDVRPLVVGDGPERGRLAARLPTAVFTGHLEGADVGRAIASADMLINPSVTEAFGNVNLEAMACGIPVVSADVASASALIQNRKSGLLVAPEDACAYADGAEQLIRSPSLRKLMALSAAAASMAFSWNEVLATVMEVYQTLV